jgi:hypothetical protein
MALGISTSSDREDGYVPDATQFITEEQCDELLTIADDVGADKAKFCRFFKIESFAAIPAQHFDRAKQALMAKRKTNGAAHADH